MTDSQLVSVVIPAYNAAATLDETLRSVRSQTHHALEIIVVDDGSTDDTRMVAAQHAEVDDRVQVLTQDNAGVAAARNTGWRHARSELIAFVDADDLWAPTKIERQIQSLQEGGQQVGLVYCWFARIDSQGSITRVADGMRWEGYVLHRLVRGNFVGNGSSALVRKQALIDAHGFESGLQAADAGGCEDFLFYCRVAERYHFAVVPEHLVGYRSLPQNMSSNRPRMLRSWMLVCDEMLARHPDNSDAVKIGLRNYSGWVARDALCSNLRDLPSVLLVLLPRYPSIGMKVLLMDVLIELIKKVRERLRRLYRGTESPIKVETGQRFVIGDPVDRAGIS
jgi:glycosyltransferase involved in cell wall biosynthesis